MERLKKIPDSIPRILHTLTGTEKIPVLIPPELHRKQHGKNSIPVPLRKLLETGNRKT